MLHILVSVILAIASLTSNFGQVQAAALKKHHHHHHHNPYLEVIDTGIPTNCGGGGGCCTPACTIDVFNVPWCPDGQAKFSDICKASQAGLGDSNDHKSASACGGGYIVWHASKKTNFIRVLKNKHHLLFRVDSCGTPSEGGGQCVPSGGGCKTTLVQQKDYVEGYGYNTTSYTNDDLSELDLEGA